MERELHIETIKKVKKFIFQKDFEGLKKYIEEREKEINELQHDYIDKLVDDLK